MKCLESCVVCFLMLLACGCTAQGCERNEANPTKVAYTIAVDLNGGGGNFTTVQKAIDSISAPNNKWIRILVRSGVYKEKVVIPKDKPCIYMEGAGASQTTIEYGDHQRTDTSATFTSFPDDIAVTGITFKNTFGIQSADGNKDLVPALAVRLYGDRYAFYDCGFEGLQDTIWDAMGRHYYKRCTISGGVDFIFGSGQTIFEECTLNVTLGVYAPQRTYGAITAQGRMSESDTGGFVFKHCTITGTAKTLLGRAYGAYSRVIYYQSQFSDVVLPQGWDSWKFKGQEGRLTFVEAGCKGAGADTSKRVPWLTKMSEIDVVKFASLSYVDQEGWISRLPNMGS